MRKNILAVSIAAMIGGLGFAGSASAGYVFEANGVASGLVAERLVVAPEGVGHILLVPYYSTQDGNVSLLNIVNTDTKNGKAVKLRYRGASNSDDVFDVTVLLSPGDMWSANVSQRDGVSTLTTNDNSCTLPADVNADFSSLRANGNSAETLEGYIEVLNMADIPATLAAADTGVLSSTTNPLYTSIKHVAGVPKCDMIGNSQLTELQPAVPLADAGDNPNAWNVRGFNYPTGGLMANWSIVNLSKSGSFTGEATAIAARAPETTAAAQANLVFSPQDGADVTGDITELTADPLLSKGVITASMFDLPDLSTPYVTSPSATAATEQAHALSFALATMSVTNEYMTSPSVGFATDWTFSMPSRRYSVAVNYNAPKTGGGTAPALVFNEDPQYFTTDNTKLVGSQACVTPGALVYYDTEEQSRAGGSYVISPQPVGKTVSYCGEASVLSFNAASSTVLGAKIAQQTLTTSATATATFTDGWMSIQTPGLDGIGGKLGLPVLGSAFVKALGSSANLGGVWTHRTSRVSMGIPGSP